jgi:hypothetical protein
LKAAKSWCAIEVAMIETDDRSGDAGKTALTPLCAMAFSLTPPLQSLNNLFTAMDSEK